MTKFKGRRVKVNGEWFGITIEAPSINEAYKKVQKGQTINLGQIGVIEDIKGRLSKSIGE